MRSDINAETWMMRMSFPGQGNGKYKGPEVGMSSECPGSSQKVSAAPAQQGMSWERVTGATETLGVILRKPEEHWIWNQEPGCEA